MKIVNYFSDVWNLVDIATVILFVIGFTLRIIDHESIVTQVMVFYSIHASFVCRTKFSNVIFRLASAIITLEESVLHNFSFEAMPCAIFRFN